ncbi:hypothetical protein EDC04DRAFT_2530553, partial [Pisolithus marmoratus]
HQQVANAVFLLDHDPHIRQLYAMYPAFFIKPIKNHFALLHKKYNKANKALGSTGAGLTTEELKANP